MNFATLLALAATLVGASAKDCSFSTTIKAATGISELNACPTVEGTIKVTGDDLGAIDLSLVEKLEADLTFFNSSSATSINFNQLKTISGSLKVDALTQLHDIDFSSLSEAEKLSLISLPSLAVLNLNTGLSSAGEIHVSDTAISSLQGLTNFKSVKVLDINNNKNITLIDLANLQSASEGLTLSFNSDDTTLKLDNLQWSSNLTIEDVSDVSLGNLTTVNGSLVIAYNSFTSLDFPSLKEVGGAFQFFANEEVEDVAFDKLEEIGGEFRIYNNSQLVDLSFENLETIKGAVNIKGDFDNFTLPALEQVDGDFLVVSLSEDFSCDDFDKLHKKKNIEGHNYTCSAPKKSLSKSSTKSLSSGLSSTSESDDSEESGSSSSTKDSAATHLVAGTMVATTLMGTLLALIM